VFQSRLTLPSDFIRMRDAWPREALEAKTKMRVVILGVVLTAWLWMSAESRAQMDVSSSAIIITNGITQIAEELCKDDSGLFYFPDGLGWQVYGIGYWQPMWTDFSEYPSLQKLKSDAISSSNRCVLGMPLYGVQPLHITITLDLLSGSLILSPGCSSEELASVAAPKDYEAGQWPVGCRVVERLWEQWQTVQKDPDWKEWYGADAKPFLTFHFQLADLNEKQIYDDNVVAEEMAWEEAQAKAGEQTGMLTAMSESEGGGMMLMMQGDPCDTNVFQNLDIQTDGQGWVTVGWCAASNVVYQIQAAPEMLTNTAWEAQALYVGEGYASWTDTNAPAFPHRFYRCRGLPGDEDADGDGLSNMDEYLLGTDIDNPDTDGDGVLDGDDPNPLDPDVTLTSGAGAIRLYNAFGIYTNSTDIYLQADARSTNATVTVSAAEFFDTIVGTNGGGVAMSALDGSFNSTNEIVKATFTPSFSTNQHHVVWLHARDSNGVWGQFVKVVVNPNVNDILAKIQTNYSAFADLQFDVTLTEKHNGVTVSTETAVMKMKGPYKLRTEYANGFIGVVNDNRRWWHNDTLNVGSVMTEGINGDFSASSSRNADFFWDVPLSKSRWNTSITSSTNSIACVGGLSPTVAEEWPTLDFVADYTKGLVTEISSRAEDVVIKSEYLNPVEALPGRWLFTLHRHTMTFDSGDVITLESGMSNMQANQGLADSLFDIPTQ
jgi:hypothetical protein